MSRQMQVPRRRVLGGAAFGTIYDGRYDPSYRVSAIQLVLMRDRDVGPPLCVGGCVPLGGCATARTPSRRVLARYRYRKYFYHTRPNSLARSLGCFCFGEMGAWVSPRL